MPRIKFGDLFRQRLTFPGGRPPSIISAKELNYCVRDGNRCDLFAIATEYMSNTFRCLDSFFSVSKTERRRVNCSCLLHNCLGQALDLLVSVSLIRYRTYTSDLSTT